MVKTSSMIAALGAILFATAAHSADLRDKSMKDPFADSINKVDFSGAYVGVGAGGMFANTEVGTFDGIGSDGGLLEGVVGWDVRRGSFVFGPRVLGAITNVSTELAGSDVATLDAYVVIGGRAGVVFNRTLVYAHAGYEFDFLSSDIKALDTAFDKADTNAWNVGLGVETMFGQNTSFALEGAYVDGIDDAKGAEAFRGLGRLIYRH